MDVYRARAEMRKLIGDVQVVATDDEVSLYASERAFTATLLRAAGMPGKGW